MQSAAIVVRDLRVARGGVDVLHGISLDVPRGCVTGLIGPSGGGKTTLMRSIVGVQIVAAGTVEVLGEAAGHPLLRHRIGYVTQSPSVYFDLTARENLAYFCAVLGAPAGDVNRVLTEVDLQQDADRVVARLSGGQQARVSLAVALLGEPELIVLDEPTAGVDLPHQQALAESLATLASRGATVVLVAHELGPLAPLVDRAVVMRDGRVAYDGPALTDQQVHEPAFGQPGLLHDHFHGHHHGTPSSHDHAPHVGGPWEGSPR